MPLCLRWLHLGLGGTLAETCYKRFPQMLLCSSFAGGRLNLRTSWKGYRDAQGGVRMLEVVAAAIGLPGVWQLGSGEQGHGGVGSLFCLVD